MRFKNGIIYFWSPKFALSGDKDTGVKKIILVCVISAFITGSLYKVYTFPYFCIETIEFKNNHYVPTWVLDKLFEPLKGQNILTVLSSSLFKNQWLTLLKPVRSLHFRYELPHKVIITVKEKTPWASFMVNNKLLLIASDGSIINFWGNQSDVANPEKIMIMHGLPIDLFRAQVISQDLLNKTKLIYEKLYRHIQSSSIQIVFSSPDELKLLYNDTLPVQIGRLENLEEKVMEMQCFLKYVEENKPSDNVVSMDLRIPTKIVVKYEAQTY